jgi:nucleotide-binding universal stress UspA family protein
MLKHILVPLDGSLLAEKALDVVKHMLPPSGKITLLSAVSTTDPMPIVHQPSSGDTPLDRYLEHVALRMRLEGFEVETEIRVGDAAEVIAQAAVPLGIDIIAMCSHGRAGLERILTGSVTNKLLGITPCPVLIIPDRVRERLEEPAADAGEEPDTTLGLAPE